jgi:monovalent cation:H+ antiporter-2, CPA2 family
MTAAVVTLLCKSLRQPVVLGYLIAGFLVGPHFPFVHTVSDIASITVWAEIGVIFLLFSLGLEFSFKKLAKVGGGASIIALFEIVFMLAAGYLTGRAIGWSHMDSLFLGGILSISSTTIIVRAFEELGLKGRSFVNMVFGVLIVEDLVAILLLVLLSTIGATASFSGPALFASSVRLGFFLALWFLVGIYLLPMLMGKIKTLLTDETALIISIGLCLMMVMIATKVGFSPALGAFVMGSLLAETREGHRIEKLLLPVRDLFAAVFFVSVGMLIDPSILWEHFGVIMLLTFVTIFGKFFSSTVGALVSGQSLKTSIQAGLSLAQIGEFSFIIATLGMSLGVISDFLYPIAVAVSAITTFSTPYQIKYSGVIYAWIERRLSPQLLARVNRYQSTVSQTSGHTIARLLWEEYGMKIILNSVVIIGITLTTTRLVYPWLFEQLPMRGPWLTFMGGAVTLLLSAPFLWAVVVGAPAHLQDYDAQTVNQLRRLQFGLFPLRLIVGMLLISFVVGHFAPLQTISGIIFIILLTIGVFFNKFAEPFYRSIELRFIKNLKDKDLEELAKKNTGPELAPWQATLAQFIVSPSSTLVAKPLHESMLKEKFGLTLAMIQRGEKRILAPGRDDLLLPFDRLHLIGEEAQLISAQKVIETTESRHDPLSPEAFGLESLLLGSHSHYINRSIRECGLRDDVQGLIVGLERDGQRVLSPDSAMILREGDVMWIVGDRRKISTLKKAPRL